MVSMEEVSEKRFLNSRSVCEPAKLSFTVERERWSWVLKIAGSWAYEVTFEWMNLFCWIEASSGSIYPLFWSLPCILILF